MSLDWSNVTEEKSVEVVPEVESLPSTVETPSEERSSLLFILNEKTKEQHLQNQKQIIKDNDEICTKYIAMSDSFILSQVYYNYPAVSDPGINKALLEPEDKIVYTDDGKELYLSICKEMNQCPVGLFHRSLNEDVINLSYYCVDPNGVRAMAIALEFNKRVRVLNLTDNFLNEDACYHLGVLLGTNTTLKELNLSGCRIGPDGARNLFAGLANNSGLEILNLDRNQLGDQGGEYLASLISRRIDVERIYLSHNNFGTKTAVALADAFTHYNTFTHIDLSWNNFNSVACCCLFDLLELNHDLQELKLSWNALYGPQVGNSIKKMLMAPNLNYLDISHNDLQGEAMKNLLAGLAKAVKLKTLDLSYNPLSIDDALLVLSKLRQRIVKVQNVFMKNVTVNDDFLRNLENIKRITSKKDIVVTYGDIRKPFTGTGPDLREVVMNRAEYLVNKKTKKPKHDIGVVFLQLAKDNPDVMEAQDFQRSIKKAGVNLDQNLKEEIVNIFPGPKAGKNKTIDMKALVDYVKRKWPNSELPPPTPPPEVVVDDTPPKTDQKGNQKKQKGKTKSKAKK